MGQGPKQHGVGEKEHDLLLFTILEQGMTDTITKAGLQSQLRVNPPN